MDYNKAIQIAIRKYKHMWGNYFDEVIDNENYQESDDEEDNDDDDDDDNDETEEEED